MCLGFSDPVGVLEDHLDALAVGPESAGGERQDINVSELHGAGIRRDDAYDQTCDRRFSGTRLPDHSEGLAAQLGAARRPLDRVDQARRTPPAARAPERNVLLSCRVSRADSPDAARPASRGHQARNGRHQ